MSSISSSWASSVLSPVVVAASAIDGPLLHVALGLRVDSSLFLLHTGVRVEQRVSANTDRAPAPHADARTISHRSELPCRRLFHPLRRVGVLAIQWVDRQHRPSER